MDSLPKRTPRAGSANNSANESASALRRNVVVNYINLLRATAIGLLLTPVLIRALGEESFGVWSLIVGTAGYIGLVEAGLSTALVARIAATEAAQDREGMATLLRTGRLLLAGSAALGILVVGGMSLALATLFELPAGTDAESRLSFLLFGASAIVAIIETSWTAALVGIGRIDVPSLISLVLTTALAFAQVVLALEGMGIVGLAAASLAIAVLSAITNRIATRRMLRDLPRGRANRPTARSLVSLGARNLLVSVSALLAYGSDVVIVGAVAGPRPAAAYAVASRAAAFTKSLATSASNVLIPNFGSADARGDSLRLQRLYRGATFAGLFIAVPIALSLSAVATPLLELWVGSNLPGASATLVILSVLVVAQVPGHVAFICLMGAQRSSLLVRFSLPSALCNLSFSIAFTIWLGVIGPALGSLLATLLVDPFLVRRLAADVLRTSGRQLYREVFALIVVPTFACLPVAFAAYVAANHLPLVAAPALAAATGISFLLATVAWIRSRGVGARAASSIGALPLVGGWLARLVNPRRSSEVTQFPEAYKR